MVTTHLCNQLGPEHQYILFLYSKIDHHQHHTTTENWLQWNGLFYLDTNWDKMSNLFRGN